MKGFIRSFYWAKTFNRNLYYCNKKQKYFHLGHCIPQKCCDLIKLGETTNSQQILLNELIHKDEAIEKLNISLLKLNEEINRLKK